MMTTEDNTLFIDTNILIYATIAESPFHQAAREAIKIATQEKQTLWVSRQILREYLVIVTRPQSFDLPLSKEQAIHRITFFENTFNVADDLPQVTQNLLALLNNYSVGGKQIHDANIVATMQAYHINRLLTYNTNDFKRFNDIIQLESL